MLRYLKMLEDRDLSLTSAMIPLGSCTMKLNATTEMIPVTWRRVQPAPSLRAPGPGRRATSCFQPAGIGRWPRSPGSPRSRCSPMRARRASSPASWSSGPITRRGAQGHRDDLPHPPVRARHQPGQRGHGRHTRSWWSRPMRRATSTSADLRAKAAAHKDTLAALMVTYPSTHGVFESSIKEVCRVVHEHGGQVYMDGANMNAQVGLCRPGDIGADVCHLNLHKTFCIPHGGGGPGMGPIGVARHLAPFLPNHPVGRSRPRPGQRHGVGGALGQRVDPSDLVAYITMMGYRRSHRGDPGRHPQRQLHRQAAGGPLQPALQRARTDSSPTSASSTRGRSRPSAGVEVEDIAKRIIDYGFHPADGLLPRRRHADGRADRERVQGGARPVLSRR